MLKILGDICFADGYFDRGRGVGSAITAGVNPFQYLNRSDDDFWIGNFECVSANSRDSHFVISHEALDNVRHLDLYGVANNHSMQIGAEGYKQTVDYLERRNIKYVGSCRQRSTEFSHQDKKIGITAFSMRPDNFSDEPLYWHLPELSDIADEIKKLKDCDFRIAFIHWGYEFINRPNIEQRQMAHWLVDTGIDLVVGMHPHVAQGAEIYKNKSIFYSLGNTLFNMPWAPTRYGLMINVNLSDDEPKVWSDYTAIGDDFFPRIVEDVPHEFTRQYLDSLIPLVVENEIYFSKARDFTKQYTRANRKAVVKRMVSMPMSEKVSLISDFVKRRLFKR